MGKLLRVKLNWLQHNMPEGMIVDAAWLERHGYSRGLRKKYVVHGWLDAVARGVYRRPEAGLSALSEERGLRWQRLVISLQSLLQLPLALGGRTALELQGFSHYLIPKGPREIHLYGNKPVPWLSRLPLDRKFVFHSAGKLFRPENAASESDPREDLPGNSTAAYAIHDGLIRQPWGDGEWPMVMSSPERAILELLDEVPQHETFHQADMLMEGLSNLSPQRLQKLLAECRSVKVKRLFFWLAERHDHAWLKKLDRSSIDLGRGKRMLVRGGKFDKKYNITVPEAIDGSL